MKIEIGRPETPAEPVLRKTYEVLTWDMDEQKFTPQMGVRRGPYRLFGLRRALRKLNDMGYDTRRAGAPSVLVQER